MVGRGQCSKPYYDNDTSLCIITNSEDLRREPSRTHGFLSIGYVPIDETTITQYKNGPAYDKALADQNDLGNQHLIVDACAGPRYGELNREDYLTTAIDNNVSDDQKARFFQGDRWQTLDAWRTGITGSTNDIGKSRLRGISTSTSTQIVGIDASDKCSGC